VVVDFGRPVSARRAVLDWEAAFADAYRIEARLSAPPPPPPSPSAAGAAADDGGWKVLFDGTSPAHRERRTSATSGQSPGVMRPTPLHVVHTVALRHEGEGGGDDRPNLRGQPQQPGDAWGAAVSADDAPPVFRYLRVMILKPAMGWGVSLWQLDVYAE
jgi:hypothetical protein